MAKPTIIYFDIRARAEPIRLILEELGIEYEDQQVRPEDWPELKPKTPLWVAPRVSGWGSGDLAEPRDL